jgi:hypothetical protein
MAKPSKLNNEFEPIPSFENWRVMELLVSSDLERATWS